MGEEIINASVLGFPPLLVTEELSGGRKVTKAEAIRIIVPCAEAYHKNLENTNLLIAHARNSHSEVQFFEVVFLPRHFLHLTGVKFPEDNELRSVEFYQKCLQHRLSESDFDMAPNGTTAQKLSVLPSVLKRNLSAKMIGDYKDRSIKLYTEKVAGTISACIGFVYEDKIGYNSPNTVLKKDTRIATRQEYARILAIYQKGTTESQYSSPVYVAKDIDWEEILNLHTVSEA